MYYLLGQDKRSTCHTLRSHSDSVQTSFLPGRMGLPWSNSAKMQPTDHMSTAGVYLVDPIRSSGGLPVSNNCQLVSSKKQKSWHIQIQSQAAFKMILYRGCKSDPLILGGENQGENCDTTTVDLWMIWNQNIPIPKCNHTICKWLAILITTKWPCQPKIRKLQVSIVVDQQIWAWTFRDMNEHVKEMNKHNDFFIW